MKVLWLTFTVFPEVMELLSRNEHRVSSGGWLLGAANSLLEEKEDLKLRVAIVSRTFTKYSEIQGNRIYYYLIPYGEGFDSYHHGYDHIWRTITDEFNPDVVHVHGIESSLGLSYIRTCGNQNVVFSIQGLFDIIARYMFHGRSFLNMIKNVTLRDIVKFDSFLSVKHKALNRGYIKDTMSEGRYFIGRTSWDRAHLWAVNPTADYLFCNETLRDAFYTSKWTYENCVPHTIFLSSMKGLHMFLKAFVLVLREFPDAQIRIASSANIHAVGFRERIYQTGYEKEIQNFIQQNNLWKNITLLGSLSDFAMKKEFLNSNLFVCPSSCENSSNAVGEAQLLGVPTVASYVGGMHDLIPNTDCGILYRYDEYEMLAHFICQMFETSKEFDNTTMREYAHKRHNKKINAQRTIDIYNYIIDKRISFK